MHAPAPILVPFHGTAIVRHCCSQAVAERLVREALTELSYETISAAGFVEIRKGCMTVTEPFPPEQTPRPFQSERVPLSPISETLYLRVMDTLQSAEERGGPEGPDYANLMQAISQDALRRRATWIDNYTTESQ